MAIRIIVRVDDFSMAANVGGNVQTSYRTFEIDHPQIEALITPRQASYSEATVVGAEIVAQQEGDGDD